MADSLHTPWHSYDHDIRFSPPLTGMRYQRDELERAAALRETEVEAARDDTQFEDQLDDEETYSRPLEDLSIDELRILANALDIPNRGAITDTARLIWEIRRRLLLDESWDMFPSPDS